VTLPDEIKEIEKIFQQYQDDFKFQAVTELLNSENMQMGWRKSRYKYRLKEDKYILTLNLALQGIPHRKIGEFCGISHQAVTARLRKAISILKAQFPDINIWEKTIGEEKMNVTLSIEDTFSASHTLVGHPGPCARLHGHTWRVLFKISGSPHPVTGILADFHDLKKMMKAILPDHRHLNDAPGLKVPTAENISVWLYELFVLELNEYSRETGGDIKLESVTVWESPVASATYTGD